MGPFTSDDEVAVLGAGTMGTGIAELAARAGHTVRVFDSRPGAAAAAVQAIRGRTQRDAERGRLTPADAARIAAGVRPAAGIPELAGCRVVIEAVVEDLDAKRELLRAVESVIEADLAGRADRAGRAELGNREAAGRPDPGTRAVPALDLTEAEGRDGGPPVLLATNTSSLSVTAIGAALARPERLVGMHFFNPATRMDLVEIVRGTASDPSGVDAATELVRTWGKTPVLCDSTPGFVVNRIARPFYGEAQRLVEQRFADPATVDIILREAGGFRMGPFEVSDLVGQDVNLAVSRSVWEQTFHDPRYAPTVFQQRLVDAGYLGRKAGRGVYRYGPDGARLDGLPFTAPPRPAPAEVDLLDYDFGVMAPFLARIEAAGVKVNRIALDDSEVMEELPGLRLPGDGLLRVTDGSTARSWAMEAPGGLILLDWAHDPATCTRVALMAPRDVDPDALDAAIGLCQAAGVAVSVIGDAAGGVVARTVAMLVNEAVDLVARGEASATDVDVAMLLGTGYPSGPLEWGDRVGAIRVAAVLSELDEETPTGRYRLSPRLDEAIVAEENLRDL